jgi:acyl transferase domain-containing protein
MFHADEDLQLALRSWMSKGKYDRLLELWASGAPIDWAALRYGQSLRRMSLPVYPFAQERYWIDSGKTLQQRVTDAGDAAAHREIADASRGEPARWALLSEAFNIDEPPETAETLEAGHEHIVVFCDGRMPAVAALTSSDYAAYFAGSLQGVRSITLESRAADDRGLIEACAVQLGALFAGFADEHPERSRFIQMVVPDNAPRADLVGLASVLEQIAAAHPTWVLQTIVIDADERFDRVVAKLKENRRAPRSALVRYDAEQRLTREWGRLDLGHAPGESAWLRGGVYLVVTNAGPDAQSFVAALAPLAEAHGARIVVASDSAVAAGRPSPKGGATGVVNVMVDLDQPAAAQVLVHDVREWFGRIDGLICLSGALSPLGGDEASLLDHLAELDSAAHAADLGFFCALDCTPPSARAASLRDAAVLTAFGYQRERLRAEQRRFGRTLVLTREAGCSQLTAHDFARICDHALSNPRCAGMLRIVAPSEAVAQREPQAAPSETHACAAVLPQVTTAQSYLTALVASLLLVPPQRIDPEAPLADYGIDSLSEVRLLRSLENDFGALSKTLLLEFQSIAALAGHLRREHGAQLAALIERSGASATPAATSCELA